MFLELNMPKFDSPLGSKSFSGQPLREFDVPDGNDTGIEYPTEEQLNPNFRPRGQQPVARSNRLGGHAPQVNYEAALEFQEKLERETSEEASQFEREIREAREAKRTGKTRLNEGARRRIEMLVGMSRTTREFEIDGHKYALQTLSSKEMRTAIMEAAAFDGTVQSPFEIRRQLLAYSLTLVAGLAASQFVGSEDMFAKLELIDSLDEALLNRLYDEYLMMVAEARGKYSIKSDEEAKEVIEDLKK